MTTEPPGSGVESDIDVAPADQSVGSKAELKRRVQMGYSRSWVVRKYSSIGLWPSEQLLLNRFLPPKGLFLDLGCGAGRTTVPLALLGYRVCGVDLAEPMCRRGRILARRAGAPSLWTVGDAERLPFDDGVFNGVLFSYNGIELVPGAEAKQRVLAEIWRVLEPGGVLIFTTHAFEAFNKYLPFRLRQFGRLLVSRLLDQGIEETEVGEVIAPAEENVEVYYLQVISPRRYRRWLANIGFNLEFYNSRSRVEQGRRPNRFLADLDADFKFYVARKPDLETTAEANPHGFDQSEAPSPEDDR
jgi:SAM-dependent methyltransferase